MANNFPKLIQVEDVQSNEKEMSCMTAFLSLLHSINGHPIIMEHDMSHFTSAPSYPL